MMGQMTDNYQKDGHAGLIPRKNILGGRGNNRLGRSANTLADCLQAYKQKEKDMTLEALEATLDYAFRKIRPYVASRAKNTDILKKQKEDTDVHTMFGYSAKIWMFIETFKYGKKGNKADFKIICGTAVASLIQVVNTGNGINSKKYQEAEVAVKDEVKKYIQLKIEENEMLQDCSFAYENKEMEPQSADLNNESQISAFWGAEPPAAEKGICETSRTYAESPQGHFSSQPVSKEAQAEDLPQAKAIALKVDDLMPPAAEKAMPKAEKPRCGLFCGAGAKKTRKRPAHRPEPKVSFCHP